MIALLLDWLLLVLIFFSTGKIFIRIYLKSIRKEDEKEYSTIETFFIGLLLPEQLSVSPLYGFPQV